MTILEHFPLKTIRRQQEQVLTTIEAQLKKGVKVILLEAPVGSGKSPMAITLARYFGQAHIITPQKALQDQYFSDFEEHIVLMKGRAAYPCTIDSSQREYKVTVDQIKQGYIKAPARGEMNCGIAPCIGNSKVRTVCKDNRACPYDVAAELAAGTDIVVHNLHSFVYQAVFANKFVKKPLMVIDEAHEVEGILRDFGSTEIKIPVGEKFWKNNPIPTDLTSINEWCDWFSDELITKHFSSKVGSGSTKLTSQREEFLAKIEDLRLIGSCFKDRFAMDTSTEKLAVGDNTIFKIIPDDVGNLFRQYIYSFCDVLVLMSGTIFSKDLFCKYLGINPEAVTHIQVASNFPVKNRPIFAIKELMCDTSFAKWDANFPTLLTSTKKLIDKFPEDKGLIHTPSYLATQQLTSLLKSDRIITHDQHNFQRQLEKFFELDKPAVFVSPICQQGVDFKDSRARFQGIVRIPYPNAGDSFIKYKMAKDPVWFAYQALVTFVQQTGRVVRSAEDWGVTVLLDERFTKFIQRYRRLLPSWLLDAIITKDNLNG